MAWKKNSNLGHEGDKESPRPLKDLQSDSSPTKLADDLYNYRNTASSLKAYQKQSIR